MFSFLLAHNETKSQCVELVILIRGAVVAERLRPLTSIPEVPGSNPGPAVAPLGKALYPHCLVFRRRL